MIDKKENSFLKSFTLIEMMLVVIIIAALAAMVVPRLSGRGEQARIVAAQADINVNIASALKLYELDNGIFPITKQGLNALLENPGIETWKGPYIEKKPLDPWGKDYLYKSPGTHRIADYDLYSLGRDGKESMDDIVNW